MSHYVTRTDGKNVPVKDGDVAVAARIARFLIDGTRHHFLYIHPSDVAEFKNMIAQIQSIANTERRTAPSVSLKR